MYFFPVNPQPSLLKVVCGRPASRPGAWSASLNGINPIIGVAFSEKAILQLVDLPLQVSIPIHWI